MSDSENYVSDLTCIMTSSELRKFLFWAVSDSGLLVFPREQQVALVMHYESPSHWAWVNTDLSYRMYLTVHWSALGDVMSWEEVFHGQR